MEEMVADVVDGPVARAAGRAVNGVRYALGYGTWAKPGISAR